MVNGLVAGSALYTGWRAEAEPAAAEEAAGAAEAAAEAESAAAEEAAGAAEAAAEAEPAAAEEAAGAAGAAAEAEPAAAEEAAGAAACCCSSLSRVWSNMQWEPVTSVLERRSLTISTA